jgi:hypothetical protein
VPSPVVAVIVAKKHRKNTSTSTKYSFYFFIEIFYFSAGDYGLTRGGSNTNYPYNEADNSPGSYDNKIHVSEIYGNRMLQINYTFYFYSF